ncbi:4'-phosphopantetheinyl transferase family protein [Puniceibacterium confluentis]|uniref:4'-phosphopantetheinyl transferase family protein n=1 Tax=Puniceibacterium confluentis TaxID=1958944 RepID=UPI0016480241|nr:4'-phosphopantetheinyl transferase superfamily protein [Puniceibacterium confluentis]
MDLSPLPHWLEQDGRCAAAMALDGGEMAALGVALPPALDRAVAKRRGEYRAGRTCARRAMQRLSPAPAAANIDASEWPEFGPDRAPVWPTGVTGSLTHSAAVALCVAGPARQFAGLGIDIELPVPAQEGRRLAPRIYCPSEFEPLAGTDWAEVGFTLLFSSKEAIYKAIYPTVQRFVDFHQARLLSLSGDKLVFALSDELSQQLGHQHRLYVRAARWQGHILTFCALAARGTDANTGP